MKPNQTMDIQHAINEAAEAVFTYFDDVMTYSDMLEAISDANVELMALMELNSKVATTPSIGIDGLSVHRISDLLHNVNAVSKLLRPFARLTETTN